MDLDADMYKGGAIDNFHMTKIEPSEIPEFVQKNELYLTKKKQIENMIKAWEQNKSVKLKFPIKQAQRVQKDMRAIAKKRKRKGLDIHKAIGKIPKPKAGWTPGRYKYMGPYNPLDKQLEYDKNTGEVTKWHVQPYNQVDEIAAYHDIVMIWVRTREIVIGKWLHHWTRFHMVKCQSGDQQHDF